MTPFSIFLVLITIVCLLLIIVIMVQNPKGGGLSSTFGGSQMMGSVQKTTDFLDKSTWVLGGTLILLIILSSLSFTASNSDSRVIDEQEIPATQAAPASQTPSDNTATPAGEQQNKEESK